jgi:hypothetical protein
MWQKLEGKWAGRVGQVVEHLPNKWEVLSSNPSIIKRKKEREGGYLYMVPAKEYISGIKLLVGQLTHLHS